MIKWYVLLTFVCPKNTVSLPSKELSSVIARSLPIGLSLPSSPISLFLPFVFVSYDEHDAHNNDYYTHIVVFVLYCIFNFISCSVINLNNIRGSKYFPESLHLHDKCRCGPVVRLPVFPLVAIFCPALTCWPLTTSIFDRWRNEHVQMP